MSIPKQEDIKFIMLHNFSNAEISKILAGVKSLYKDPNDRKKLVFTKTTEQSKKMLVEELIEDASEDHLYLLENPPQKDENGNLVACQNPKEQKNTTK